jgi:hypothetical protein
MHDPLFHTVLAFDLGERCGIARLDCVGGSPLAIDGTDLTLTHPDDIHRGHTLQRFLDCVIATVTAAHDGAPDPPPITLVWELIRHSAGRADSNMDYLMQHGELRAMLMLAAYRTGADIDAIPIGTWKKALCGNGNAKKPEVRVALLRRFPGLDSGTNQDQLDALGIGLAFAELRLKPRYRKVDADE